MSYQHPRIFSWVNSRPLSRKARSPTHPLVGVFVEILPGCRHLPFPLPTWAVAAFILITSSLAPCQAGTITVDQTRWGDPDDLGTLAWAINKANTELGFDVIDINVGRGTQINIDAAKPVLSSFISQITDTLTINGNGAVLWGDPAFVTTGGLVKDKYTVSKPVDGDVFEQPAYSFTTVGTGVELTINDLMADGVNGFVRLEENAVVNLNDVTVKNTVPYGFGARAVVDASAGSVANLTRVVMERINMLEELIADGESAWAGAVAGVNATLNMMESVLRGSSSSAGGVNWLGGTANIVSSIFDSNAGGLSIFDDDEAGVLNVTNSLFRLSGDSGTSRIQALLGGEANIVASTVQVQNLEVFETSESGYTSSGVPLRTSDGGAINLQQSVISLLNQGFPGIFNDPAYDNRPIDGIGTPGTFTADAATYISPTSTQSLADLQLLFGQDNLLTDPVFRGTVSPGDPPLDGYLPLPAGAYPVGNLINTVADADGVNQLINPIDGTVLTKDVYGNPRTTGGFRDSGAVQHVPEPSSILMWSTLALVVVGGGRRRAK